MFKTKKIGKYHDFYSKKNVLLLCDVFDKFIDTCLKYYSLDPSHYFSSPGLSWNAMLKVTGIKLELISDTDMHERYERWYFLYLKKISKSL